MADPKGSKSGGDAPKAAAPSSASSSSSSAPLARASESTDPAIQQLIAQLDIVRRNGQDDQADALVSQLADLGYSA